MFFSLNEKKTVPDTNGNAMKKERSAKYFASQNMVSRCPMELKTSSKGTKFTHVSRA
jgi:hypothetical protein